MGFFDILVDSVTGAVDWAVSNSGEIKQVFDAVATVVQVVAPLVLVAEEDEGTPDYTNDDLIKLQKNYVKASKILDKRSEITADAGIDGDDVSSTRRTICGLWSLPTTLTNSGNASMPLYQDVSKFLTMSGVPATWTTSNGTRDTAADVAAAFFANAPTAYSSIRMMVAKGEQPDPIKTADVYLKNNSNTCVIQGRHAYYDIPLGERVSSSSWHAAMQVRTTATDDFIAEYAAFRARWTINAADTTTDTAGVDVWLVTLKVVWSNAADAENAQETFLNLLGSDYPTYKIRISALQGTCQVLKVEAPPDISPARVRAVVLDVSRQATATYLAANTDTGDYTITGPTVLVTCSAIVQSTAS